mgnify:CR=1 FL=1
MNIREKRSSSSGLFLAILFGAFLGGCVNGPTQAPNYSAPLPAGGTALRPVQPGNIPNLVEAWKNRDSGLRKALEGSIHWYTYPSSQSRFPYQTSSGEITHADAKASVERFYEVLVTSRNADQFDQTIRDEFQVYESVGWNGKGIVLFTGYYAPEFDASRDKNSQFRHPVYRRPTDLVTHPKDGKPLGQRQADGSITRYPTRAEIEDSKMHEGNELLWMESSLDAYVVHVNGSAKLTMPDGEVVFIGYDGKTDRPYTGLGSELISEGLLDKDELSLGAIYTLHDRNPGGVERLIRRNDNYVYFTEYDGSTWPSGSLGVKVQPRASLATDKEVYPPGAVCLVDTQGVTVSGRKTEFLRFMLDQDTGGAIKAPGRGDIYMGEGDTAESLAGGQYAEGRLYYFFLR